MNWCFDENQPIYTQLVEQFRRAIVSGELAPGERLPAVREIAVEAGVNPNTMQRAFQELERSGLVFTQRSSGRFVTEEVTVIEAERSRVAHKTVRGFLEDMKQLGFSQEETVQAVMNYKKEENE